MKKFIFLFSCLYTIGIFPSDHLECEFTIKIKELIGKPRANKTDKKLLDQKAAFTILNVDPKSIEQESYCKTFKGQKYKEILTYSPKKTLTSNAEFKVTYTSVSSEIVKNGYVDDMITDTTWVIHD